MFAVVIHVSIVANGAVMMVYVARHQPRSLGMCCSMQFEYVITSRVDAVTAYYGLIKCISFNSRSIANKITDLNYLLETNILIVYLLTRLG